MNKEENISEVLQRRLAHHGLLKSFVASKVCSAAQEASGGKFEPVSFKRGTLKVATKTSSSGHIVKIRQREFIDKINQKLGSEQVERLVVVVEG